MNQERKKHAILSNEKIHWGHIFDSDILDWIDEDRGNDDQLTNIQLKAVSAILKIYKKH